MFFDTCWKELHHIDMVSFHCSLQTVLLFEVGLIQSSNALEFETKIKAYSKKIVQQQVGECMMSESTILITKVH